MPMKFHEKIHSLKQVLLEAPCPEQDEMTTTTPAPAVRHESFEDECDVSKQDGCPILAQIKNMAF